jgi:hypothetical protein
MVTLGGPDTPFAGAFEQDTVDVVLGAREQPIGQRP